MKKIITPLLFLLLPILCYGQFFGLGGQYSQGAKGQFVVNFSAPTYHKENALNAFVSSGMEFTTSGGARMSGLNIKPVQLYTYFSEDMYNDLPFTVLAGVDGGYLFDFRSKKDNGIILTPNLYIDYKVFFVKTGYDFDVSHGRSQFFIRAGIGIGLGTFKMIGNTKIR